MQYPCHFCLEREGKKLHLGFFACIPCTKTVKDHSACKPENCQIKREEPKP